MSDPKSLAAEIEAVLMKHVVGSDAKNAYQHDLLTALSEAAAEIAALQSRAFEDGARWMRERAHEAAEASAPDCDGEIYIARKIADEIQSLPLQTEGKRNA